MRSRAPPLVGACALQQGVLRANATGGTSGSKKVLVDLCTEGELLGAQRCTLHPGDVSADAWLASARAAARSCDAAPAGASRPSARSTGSGPRRRAAFPVPSVQVGHHFPQRDQRARSPCPASSRLLGRAPSWAGPQPAPPRRIAALRTFLAELRRRRPTPGRGLPKPCRKNPEPVFKCGGYWDSGAHQPCAFAVKGEGNIQRTPWVQAGNRGRGHGAAPRALGIRISSSSR